MSVAERNIFINKPDLKTLTSKHLLDLEHNDSSDISSLKTHIYALSLISKVKGEW